MTSPAVQTRAVSSQNSSSATDQVVTLPASIASGDLVIVAVSGGESGTFTWPGGGATWQEIADFEINAGGEQEALTVAYLAASGGETSVTVVSSVGMRTAHCSVRISGHEPPGTQAPQINTASGGSAPECNPPRVPAAGDLTGGAKDYLFIAIAGSANGGTFTAAPTDYTNLQTTNTGGTTSSHSSCGMAERALNAANTDPGVFTHDDASTRDWVAATIAVHPVTVVASAYPSDFLEPYPYMQSAAQQRANL